MAGGRPKKTWSGGPIAGPWQDVGEGTCPRCRVDRRLYVPDVRPEVRACAPCSQVVTNKSIYNPGQAETDEERAIAADDGDALAAVEAEIEERERKEREQGNSFEGEVGDEEL